MLLAEVTVHRLDDVLERLRVNRPDGRYDGAAVQPAACSRRA
jgi:hypothetical protein